ncbi:hypothetical protein ONZ45_g17029 [Pleurotus djamor]|nr:hypothetical protein ONZ45_g17029 [Pleurotus djamor]
MTDQHIIPHRTPKFTPEDYVTYLPLRFGWNENLDRAMEPLAYLKTRSDSLKPSAVLPKYQVLDELALPESIQWSHNSRWIHLPMKRIMSPTIVRVAQDKPIRWRKPNTPESVASSIAARAGSAKKTPRTQLGSDQPQKPSMSMSTIPPTDGLQDPKSLRRFDKVIESLEAKFSAAQHSGRAVTANSLSPEFKAEVFNLLSSMKTRIAELEGQYDDLVKEKEEELSKMTVSHSKDLDDLNKNLEELKSQVQAGSGLHYDELLHQLAIIDVILDGGHHDITSD